MGITKDAANIKKKKIYEQLHGNSFKNLHEIGKFHERHKSPKLTQDIQMAYLVNSHKHLKKKNNTVL